MMAFSVEGSRDYTSGRLRPGKSSGKEGTMQRENSCNPCEGATESLQSTRLYVGRVNPQEAL